MAFSLPVVGRISSPFGTRVQPTAGASTDHKGIDYAVPVGTPVSAAADGVVIYAGWQSGFGNTVQLDNGGGVGTLYAHLSAISVAVGQSVGAGQVLGLSGASGTVSGPNLHFGVTLNGQWVDPSSMLLDASLPNVLGAGAGSGGADPFGFDSPAEVVTSDVGAGVDPMTVGLYVLGALVAVELFGGRR